MLTGSLRLHGAAVQTVADAERLMEATGVVGVLSAESLLVDPSLFAPGRLTPGGAYTHMDALRLARQYVDLVAQHPAPMRMVRGHMHAMLGAWLAEYTHIRDVFNRPKPDLDAYIEVGARAHAGHVMHGHAPCLQSISDLGPAP